MSGQFNMQRPFARPDVASTAYTTTTNSSNLTLPLASSYQWIIDCTALTGVGGTLDCVLQTTPDNGTTFYSTGPASKTFTQTEGAAVDIIRVQPSQGSKESGQEWAAWSSSGPMANNLILTRRYRWRFVVGGTGGANAISATVAIWLLCQAKGSGSGN